MQLSRRGFFFGLGATIAVIRTPGLIMPIKEIIQPARVPLGAVYNFFLENRVWRFADDLDAEIRIKTYIENEAHLELDGRGVIGVNIPFQEKIAKAT